MFQWELLRYNGISLKAEGARRETEGEREKKTHSGMSSQMRPFSFSPPLSYYESLIMVYQCLRDWLNKVVIRSLARGHQNSLMKNYHGHYVYLS